MKHFIVNKGDDIICLIKSTSRESARIKLNNISFDDWVKFMEPEDIDEAEYYYNKKESFNIFELPVIL